MNDTSIRLRLVLGMFFLVSACAVSVPDSGDGKVHRWWAGLGPVLPHDTFPSDCSECHEGSGWTSVKSEFRFDHEKETGFRLEGAHTGAMCLRCHNDRGPVGVFQARGCAGCHEDVHQGDLGQTCTTCHAQDQWRAVGQIEMHSRTRFPLAGAHALTACHRCHPGALVGNFMPTDNDCVTCHRAELAGTTNPPHLGLGWVDRCDRCHIPTSWNQARRN